MVHYGLKCRTHFFRCDHTSLTPRIGISCCRLSAQLYVGPAALIGGSAEGWKVRLYHSIPQMSSC